MKYKLTKSEFEALPEEMKKEYALGGEGATLKVEGEGVPTQAEIDRLKEKHLIADKHRKEAEKSRDEAEARAEKLREDLGKASGKEQIEKIKQEHQAELEKIRGEREAEQKAAKDAANSKLKKETAEAFANEHFTIPRLMIGPFADRLSIEEIEGKGVVRVLDAEGKASALSLDELKREFLDNKDYAGIIKADAGRGGGALPGGGGGAPVKKLSDFKNGTEEAKFANDNPEEYQRMVDAEA